MWTRCHTIDTLAVSPKTVSGRPRRCLAPSGGPPARLVGAWHRSGGPPARPEDGLGRPGSYDSRMATVLPENEEAQRAWDGVLFDRFLHFKHLIVTSLALHGAAAMQAFPPAEGDRVLDIGCGLGDTTVQLAELVGPRGSALGVDISPRFIEAAEADARELGVANARFEVADVQASPFADTFDYAFARFGTMFFASPVAAMRNVYNALEPGGRLCSLVWRRREDNEWMYRAEQVVKPLVEIPEETDEARCGPGPFSLANADTASTIHQAAGFVDVALHRARPAAEDRQHAR